VFNFQKNNKLPQS